MGQPEGDFDETTPTKSRDADPGSTRREPTESQTTERTTEEEDQVGDYSPARPESRPERGGKVLMGGEPLE